MKCVNFCILWIFLIAFPLTAIENKEACFIPGQISDSNIRKVKIGSTDIYFYMTPEKHQAAINLINDLNAKKLLLRLGKI